MLSTMCNIWDDFSNWVTLEWHPVVFILVVSVLALFGSFAFVSFIKGPKYNKDKKPFKWGTLIFGFLLFGIMAIIVCAKYA